MSYKLLSIDESSKKTGWALFEDGKLVSYGLIDKSKDKDSEHRLNDMCRDILSILKKYKPNEIICEHPQGQGSNVLVVGMLCQIVGVIRAYAIEKNVNFQEVTPSVWRKYLGLKQGKKKRAELKQLSIDYVKEKYQIDATDDVADAICIGAALLYHSKEQ